ncbi:MAG: DUF3291 domain-containing protein [Acidobacteriota bacterium]
MAFISVTRLRVRSVWQLPKFLWHATRSSAQARKSAGNLGVSLLNDAKLVFWTKTAWTDEAAMRAFLLSGQHKKAMPVLMNMCDEAAVAHWVQDSATLPTWQEAHRRLRESGRSSKVRHPSAAHEAFEIPPPRT